MFPQNYSSRKPYFLQNTEYPNAQVAMKVRNSKDKAGGDNVREKSVFIHPNAIEINCSLPKSGNVAVFDSDGNRIDFSTPNLNECNEIEESQNLKQIKETVDAAIESLVKRVESLEQEISVSKQKAADSPVVSSTTQTDKSIKMLNRKSMIHKIKRMSAKGTIEHNALVALGLTVIIIILCCLISSLTEKAVSDSIFGLFNHLPFLRNLYYTESPQRTTLGVVKAFVNKILEVAGNTGIFVNL